MSRENLLNLSKFIRCSCNRLLSQLILLLLLLIEFSSFRFALALQLGQKVLVLPSDRVGQLSHDSIVSSGLETHNLESARHDDSLLLVVRFWNSLKRRETTEGFLSADRLLVNHAANGAPHHASGRLEMGRTATRIRVHGLVAELSVLDAIASYYKERKNSNNDDENVANEIIVPEMVLFEWVMNSGNKYLTSTLLYTSTRAITCSAKHIKRHPSTIHNTAR